MPAENGCPARSARPIRSIASGSCSSSLRMRRERLRPTYTYGSEPPIRAVTSATSPLLENSKPASPPASANPTVASMKVAIDQLRSACSIAVWTPRSLVKRSANASSAVRWCSGRSRSEAAPDCAASVSKSMFSRRLASDLRSR